MKASKIYGTIVLTQDALGIQYERRESKTPVYTETALGHRPDAPQSARATKPRETTDGDRGLRVWKTDLIKINQDTKHPRGYIKITAVPTQTEHHLITELTLNGKRYIAQTLDRIPRGYLMKKHILDAARNIYKTAKEKNPEI